MSGERRSPVSMGRSGAVPHMQDRLVESGRVTRRQMRRYRVTHGRNIAWALNSDDE